VSEKIQVQSSKAPAAIGPYSQAIKLGDWLFCSGQIPLVPETMQLEPSDIKLQTRRVLSNLKAVLEAAGSHPSKVVKTTVFLSDLKNFEAFNREYAEFFKEHGVAAAPARSTIEVSALPKSSLVEIEAIAGV
jgi:2-iminobutanoate/2-iminopropanoate deaminase